MAQFPITYSQASPSGRGGSVPFQLDVSTGADYIAQGMYNLGEAFDVVAQRMEQAELSEMYRKADEISFAYFNKRAQTGDAEVRKQLDEEWKQQIEAIQSKSKRVNYTFGLHKNKILPRWGGAVAEQELAIQTRQTDDRDEINFQSELQRGNLEEAGKITWNRWQADRISEAERDKIISQIPNSIVLAQSEFAINNPKGQDLKAISEKLSALTLSDPDMAQFRDELIRKADHILGNANDQYDIAIGKAASDFVKSIQNGTLSEEMVWGYDIDVALNKQSDLAGFRKEWVAVARGIDDRKLALADDNKKRAIKEAYNPQIVSELKTRAALAKTSAEIQSVKMEAAQALASNYIDDADLENISYKAETTFASLVDSTLDESDTQFARIILRGTSDESLVPWLQSQVLASQAAGRPITQEVTTKLIADFGFVAKAKQWAVNEARRQVEREVKTQEIVDVNQVRLMYLQAQKRWLNKSDTELVDEYKEWLKL